MEKRDFSSLQSGERKMPGQAEARAWVSSLGPQPAGEGAYREGMATIEEQWTREPPGEGNGGRALLT